MSSPDRLPPSLRDALLAELDPGETLRWCDQPQPSRIFRKSIAPSLVIFLLAGCFAAMLIGAGVKTYRETTELRGPAPAPRGEVAVIFAFVTLGGVIAAGALGGLAGPWLARAKAQRAVYALTNTRVFTLVRTRAGRINTDVCEPSHPLSISRREHADGSGDISLYPVSQNQRAQLRLIATPSPRTVERLIRTTFDPPGAS